jgi:hypothetical protein
VILAISGMGAWPLEALSAPPEPVDTEFLDYLAGCEGEDDNWTVVASERERVEAAKPPEGKTPAKEAVQPEEVKP